MTSAALLLRAKEVSYKGKLAMKMGGEYVIRRIQERHLRRAAADIGVDSEWMLATAERLAGDLPGAVEEAIDEADGLLDARIRSAFTAGTGERPSHATAFIAPSQCGRPEPQPNARRRVRWPGTRLGRAAHPWRAAGRRPLASAIWAKLVRYPSPSWRRLPRGS